MSGRIQHDHLGISLDADNDGKVGFHGATPVVKRAGASQAAVAQTSIAVVTTAPTNSSPYGFAQAQAAALIAQLNAAVVDIAALTALNNELRAALVAKGLIKGSA
jgi:hypothetical protein